MALGVYSGGKATLLFKTVANIVGLCAEPKMRRVGASTVIAGMADNPVNRINTGRKEVCDAIDPKMSAFVTYATIAAARQHAVPKPARVCFGNPAPEAPHKGGAKARHRDVLL